jgi:thioesterase domain-containing protein
MNQVDDQRRIALEQDLTQWWVEVLGVDEVGPHDDFFYRGGDQERGARMLQKVKAKYQVAIPTQTLYEARTIGKLADLIELRRTSQEQLCIVPIRAKGNRPPLFLVHGVGGNILGFSGLAKVLHKEQPVYGIQAQSLQSNVPLLIKMEEMAAYYVQELRKVKPTGPYAFLGFSFGGLVAYEMAQQLLAAGEVVHFLGMLDTWQPGYMKRVTARQPLLKRVLYRLYVIRMNTKKLSPFQFIPYAYARLKSRLLRATYRQMAKAGPVSLPDSMRGARDVNMTAGLRYQVLPYPGKVTLFRARDAEVDLPEDLDWRRYAGEVEIIRLPGDHGQVLAEPNLSFMAGKMEECLARALRDPQPEREEFVLDTEGVVKLEVAE